MSAPASDDAFVRVAHEMGAATPEHIQAARQLQSLQAQQGVRLSLADALVQQGVLTPTLKEYDCRVTFSSTQATPMVGVILATQGRGLNWALFCGRAGFEMVDGRDLSSNRTCLNTGGWPKQGTQGTLIIQVRRDGLKTWHDGRLVLEFPTDYSNVQRHQQWGLIGDGLLGLGVMGPVAFHQFLILDVSGKGTFTRPDDPAAKEAERMHSLPR